jgi:broad specificity phosphatase PhoE
LVTLILVRHGQTDWNYDRRIQGGGSDIPLNDEGRRQARCLAERLAPDNITAIYSSPLRRALDTAQMIATPHHLTVLPEASLKEIDAAALEGTLVADIGERLRLLLNGEDEGRVLFKKHGGESLEDLKARVWPTVQQMLARHREGTLVLVSHYFVTLTIICAALGLPSYFIGKFRLGEGSLSTMILTDDATYLAGFNDRCHMLPPPPPPAMPS